MAKNLPTAVDFAERLRYEPESGFLYWISGRRDHVGKRAGTVAQNGYRMVNIFGRPWLEHRIAWLLTTGDWPLETIDHINHNRADNRLLNLRPASIRANIWNRRFSGVYFVKQRGVWHARLCVNGQRKHLGYFQSKQDATEAYRAAAAERDATFGEAA